MKRANDIQRSKQTQSKGPRRFIVFKENLNKPWVKEAVANGDIVIPISPPPWWLRLWWRIRRIFSRTIPADRSLISREELRRPPPDAVSNPLNDLDD